MTNAPMKILVELRPALHGHAGIPQETRLLFRSLALLDGVKVDGMIQHPGHLLAPGLPPSDSGADKVMTQNEKLERLGQVVISLEQNFPASLPRTIAQTAAMAFGKIFGRCLELTRFDARHFADFIWQRLFAKSLPPEDFPAVMQAGYRVARVPWEAMQICAHITRAIGISLFARLDTSDYDIFLAETPYPGLVTSNTKMVIRYHDAIPLMMPHTISDRRYHHAWHYHALLSNVKSGAWFVCVSEASRKDLLAVFPEVEARSLTIHNMVSHHFFDEPSNAELVPQIMRNRLNATVRPGLDLGPVRRVLDTLPQDEPMQFLLMVSTIEPRKNHLALLEAWERLRIERFPALRLVFVGSPGWHYKEIVEKFHVWMERGDVFLLHDVASAELRLLYKHARATICPSFGEGFDFSGVEAMRSGGVVVASDIPVHREVYGDAAEYFDPYSVDALRRAIVDVIDAENAARRTAFLEKGSVIGQRYTREKLLPQWAAFIKSLELSAA